MYRGTARQPHNEKCRDRFRELLKDDARVKNTEVRKAEFEVRESEKKKKKKEDKKEEKKRKKEVEAEESEEQKRPRDADEQMETDQGIANEPNYSVGDSSGSGNQNPTPSNPESNEPMQGLKMDLEENRDVDIQQVEQLIGEWVEEYQSGQMICEIDDNGEPDEESKIEDIVGGLGRCPWGGIAVS